MYLGEGTTSSIHICEGNRRTFYIGEESPCSHSRGEKRPSWRDIQPQSSSSICTFAEN